MLDQLLNERGLETRTLGVTDAPVAAPLQDVERLMRTCRGAMILGLAQVHIIEGISKDGTSERASVRDAYLPTPWNHLEAGMAFALGLPVLVLREEGVSGGIFDPGASDRFVHQAELSQAWIRSSEFQQIMDRWLEDFQ